MAKAQLAKEEAAGDEKNEVLESQEFSAGPQYSQSAAMSNQPAKIELCASCGLGLDGESFVCSTVECAEDNPRFHQRCTFVRDGVRLCVDCNRNAVDDASQAATQENI